MSPLPAATNGMPPKRSGFQSGTWPERLIHSALQAWNGRPALYWSLHGLASHIPVSIGNERITGHTANAAVASAGGRAGSYVGAAAAGPGSLTEPTPGDGGGAGRRRGGAARAAAWH